MRHVLLIGAEPASCDLMQLALRENGGYRVTRASSGEEALPLFRRDPPSLAIIDEAVPGMPGIEVAQRARCDAVPVLFLTDEGKPPPAEPGFATLRKPVALDELLERSRRLIGEVEENHHRLRASLNKLQASRQALRRVLGQVGKTISRAQRATAGGPAPAFDFRADPVLREALAYWETKRGTRAMPRRRDIDPAELPKHLLPQLQLLEVVEGGRRFYFRLVGTAIVAEFGREYTGKYTDEDLIAAKYVEALHACYRMVMRARRPVFVRSRYLTRKEIDITANRLLLPLSEDGEQVSMILGALTFDRLGEPPDLPWSPIEINS